MLLEESRAEYRQRSRRRGDRRWLRHAVTTLITADDTPVDDVWHAGKLAGLLLARVDARILTNRDVTAARTAVTRILGRPRLRALRDLWRTAHTTGDDDADHDDRPRPTLVHPARHQPRHRPAATHTRPRPLRRCPRRRDHRLPSGRPHQQRRRLPRRHHRHHPPGARDLDPPRPHRHRTPRRPPPRRPARHRAHHTRTRHPAHHDTTRPATHPPRPDRPSPDRRRFDPHRHTLATPHPAATTPTPATPRRPRRRLRIHDRLHRTDVLGGVDPRPRRRPHPRHHHHDRVRPHRHPAHPTPHRPGMSSTSTSPAAPTPSPTRSNSPTNSSTCAAPTPPGCCVSYPTATWPTATPPKNSCPPCTTPAAPSCGSNPPATAHPRSPTPRLCRSTTRPPPSQPSPTPPAPHSPPIHPICCVVCVSLLDDGAAHSELPRARSRTSSPAKGVLPGHTRPHGVPRGDGRGGKVGWRWASHAFLTHVERAGPHTTTDAMTYAGDPRLPCPTARGGCGVEKARARCRPMFSGPSRAAFVVRLVRHGSGWGWRRLAIRAQSR